MTRVWQRMRSAGLALGFCRSWTKAHASLGLVILAALLVPAYRTSTRASSLEGANVLLIVVDTLRADHLGFYGYGLPTSPFLDKIASRSVVFDDVTSAAPQTVPSVISLMTGVYPSRHGNHYFPETDSIRETTPGLRPTIPAELRLLAEYFRERDYRTAAVVTNPWLLGEYGFDRGFDRYFYLSGRTDASFARGNRVNAEANKLLREFKSEKFFLYLHYMDAHVPYEPPESERKLFTGPAAGRQVLSRNGLLPGASLEDIAYTKALYDAEVRFLDGLIENLFATLHTLELDRSTLVVFTSDHGEELSEHGGFGHGWNLYQDLVRTPLFFSHSKLEPLARRVASPVASVDLLPTLLGLTGAEIPDGLAGESLGGIVMNQSVGSGGRNYLFSELGMAKMVRRGQHKLIRWLNPPREEAFDLVSDPAELAPVATSVGSDTSLGTALRVFLATAPMPAALPAASKNETLDPVTAETLRALGYLN